MNTRQDASQPIRNFEELLQSVKKQADELGPLRTALVLPHESRMLPAFRRAINDGLIEPYIVGDENIFRQNCSKHDIDPDRIHFIDINQPEMAVVTAAQMGVRHEVDLILKGSISAEAFLRLIFEREAEFVKKGKQLVHVTTMKPVRYDKLLSLADAGLAVSHELKDMMAIIGGTAEYLQRFGLERPRIAVLAAVEVVYPQMESTIKGAVLSVMARRGQLKGIYLDGPLSFDVATDAEAARNKGITDSEVAGQADLLIATDLTTSNCVYKAMSLFGQVEMGGVVCGGAVPFTISAFCDSDEARFNSILLGLMAAR